MISGTTVHADINVNEMRSTEISSDAESLSDDDLEYEAIKDELSNLSYADIKEGMAEAKKLDIKLEKVQPKKKNIPEILKGFVSGFLELTIYCNFIRFVHCLSIYETERR